MGRRDPPGDEPGVPGLRRGRNSVDGPERAPRALGAGHVAFLRARSRGLGTPPGGLPPDECAPPRGERRTRLHAGGAPAPEGNRVAGWRSARLGAFAASLLWGVHPTRVEAVTWLTGRRDVLSGFFLLLTVLAYVRATEPEERRRSLARSAPWSPTLWRSVRRRWSWPCRPPWSRWSRTRSGTSASTGRTESAGGAPAPGRGSCRSLGVAVLAAAVSYLTQGRGSGVRVLERRRVARDADGHPGDPDLEGLAPHRTLAALRDAAAGSTCVHRATGWPPSRRWGSRFW